MEIHYRVYAVGRGDYRLLGEEDFLEDAIALAQSSVGVDELVIVVVDDNGYVVYTV